MYRYSADNAITYTSEDFVLFKESPFASWMERLSLENPDHGILPQAGSEAPTDTIESQDDLADTLRAEGKDVVLVSWERDEAARRTATLDAMRIGADFIVNAQLAVGPLSGAANLLMRTSGYSQFGNYLYVPCNTQRHANSHAALRLCFLADLLHSIQGQLSPQMLIIRGGSDLVTLETEDHIYHYRAVKHRFMTAQQSFRKHKMPDPAESAHFGRWAECANEVLKQRALRGEDFGAQTNHENPSNHEHQETHTQSFQTLELEPMEVNEPPVHQQRESAALSSSAETAAEEQEAVQHIELDVEYEPQRVAASAGSYEAETVNPYSHTIAVAAPINTGTLAEQARMLSTNGQVLSASGTDNDTLENLSFIGSSSLVPTIGQKSQRSSRSTSASTPKTSRAKRENSAASVEKEFKSSPKIAASEREPRSLDPTRAAPPPSLRNPEDVARTVVATPIPPTVDFEKLVYEKAEPLLENRPVMEKTHPLDSAGFQSAKKSLVDLDAAAESVSSEDAPLPGLAGFAPLSDSLDLPDAPDLPISLDAVEPSSAVEIPAPEVLITEATIPEVVAPEAAAPEAAAPEAAAPEAAAPEANYDTIERSMLDDRAQYSEIFADSDDFLGRPKTNKFTSSLNTSDDSLLGNPETER
ncbi:MAG: hypothetical protein AB8B81_03815 [Halioglobus sp.]